MSSRLSARWSLCAVGVVVGAGSVSHVLVEAAPPAVDTDGTLASRVNETLGLSESTTFGLELLGDGASGLIAVAPIDGLPQILLLEPHSVRSERYRLLVQQPDGSIVEAEPGPVNTYRGALPGVEGSVVAASLLDDGLHARVLYPDGTDFWIEPLHGRVRGAAAGEYVAYSRDAVLPSGGTCATDAETWGVDLPDAGAPQPVGGGQHTAELACETDYEFFSARGDEAGVEAWINQVVNAVNVQYERDVQITHAISDIVVRTSSNDPYNNTRNASSLLNQFRDLWESNPPTTHAYDLAQMFTGRSIAGGTIGVAWLGSVCTSYRYSLVQSLFNGNGDSPDAYATDLTAHELGHNWGADHCSCTSHTMNPYITGTNVFHPTFSIPEIVAHRDSRTCLDGGGSGPATGGCCLGTGCSIQTAADCASAGGTYQGDGSDCSGGPCGGTVGGAIVDCITYTTRGGPNQNKHLDVTVRVVDGSGGPVAGANVSMTLNGASPYGFGGATDAAGDVTFTLLGAPDGCYWSDVTGITGGGSFDGTEPANGFQKGADSTPDADCRSGSDGCGPG